MTNTNIQKWEYNVQFLETIEKSYVARDRDERIQRILNEAGLEGWELVSFLPAAKLVKPDGGVPRDFHLIFKRPIRQNNSPITT